MYHKNEHIFAGTFSFLITQRKSRSQQALVAIKRDTCAVKCYTLWFIPLLRQNI